jgi:hypothetical protein
MPRPIKIEDQAALPFPPYGSFVGFLDDLNAMGVLPNRLNPSVFGPSYSGSTVNLILRALRLLGLTDGDVPNIDRLKGLVDKETRSAALERLLREKYAGLFALPLATADPSQINEWFAKSGMDATATRKAKAFFFTAARENGIEIHPSVAGKAPRRGLARRRKGIAKRRDGFEPPLERTAAPSGSTKTVHFRSGGTATLSVSVDVVNLSPSDRRALFSWIDAMTEYENQEPADSTAGSNGRG